MDAGSFIVIMSIVIGTFYSLYRVINIWEYNETKVKQYVSDTRENKNKELYERIEENKLF
ncbi:MAG TPA: hypothetical protein DCE23_04345 [Firmicutes bacterium]|nr:hypothetical protein [Bacillota bacterium]